MIVLILPWEKRLNFGHGKLRQVMEKVTESRGILKVSKSTNPVSYIWGRHRALWLVCSTPNWLVQMQALPRDIALCSWVKHFTLTVPLSLPRCIYCTSIFHLVQFISEPVHLLWTGTTALCRTEGEHLPDGPLGFMQTLPLPNTSRYRVLVSLTGIL